jgi:hypothetical protein
MLGAGKRLAREQSLVGRQIEGFEQSEISRYNVASGQLDNITNDKRLCSDRFNDGSADNVALWAGQDLQGKYTLFSFEVLYEAVWNVSDCEKRSSIVSDLPNNNVDRYNSSNNSAFNPIA